MVARSVVGGGRLKVDDSHRLAFVVQVGMESHQLAILMAVLEHYGVGSSKSGTVEREGHIDCAVDGFGREGGFGGNFLAVCQQCFTRRLIHQLARHGVLFANSKPGVGHRVYDSHFGGCLTFMCARNSVKGGCVQLALGILYSESGSAAKNHVALLDDALVVHRNGDFLGTVHFVAARRFRLDQMVYAMLQILDFDNAVFVGQERLVVGVRVDVCITVKCYINSCISGLDVYRAVLAKRKRCGNSGYPAVLGDVDIKVNTFRAVTFKPLSGFDHVFGMRDSDVFDTKAEFGYGCLKLFGKIIPVKAICWVCASLIQTKLCTSQGDLVVVSVYFEHLQGGRGVRYLLNHTNNRYGLPLRFDDYRMLDRIERVSVGSLGFVDDVLAQIQTLYLGVAVFIGGNGAHGVACVVANGAVAGHDVVRGFDRIVSTGDERGGGAVGLGYLDGTLDGRIGEGEYERVIPRAVFVYVESEGFVV